MRTIAVPVANRPECAVALDVAFPLAAKLGSDVIGYHIRPNRRESKELDLHSLVDTDGAWPAESEAHISKAAISAKELFSEMAQSYSMELARKHGTPAAPKAVFREKLGSADKLFPFIGPVSDLMVARKPVSL
jgi:nucleotide-binding universal stress UspA family protein